MSKDLLRRVKTAEIKTLRSVAGYTVINRQRNEVIREYLEIFNLADKIADFRRIGLIMSAGWMMIPFETLNYIPGGHRGQGIPFKRWIEQL